MYKFKGKKGEFIPGVPSRDLTNEEAKAHGVEKHPLYEKQTRGKSDKPQGSDD